MQLPTKLNAIEMIIRWSVIPLVMLTPRERLKNVGVLF